MTKRERDITAALRAQIAELLKHSRDYIDTGDAIGLLVHIADTLKTMEREK